MRSRLTRDVDVLRDTGVARMLGIRGGALVLGLGTTAGRWNRRYQLDIADGPHHNPGKTHPHDPDVDGDIPKNQAVVELDVETWEVSRRCAAREYTRTSVRPSRAGRVTRHTHHYHCPYPPRRFSMLWLRLQLHTSLVTQPEGPLADI